MNANSSDLYQLIREHSDHKDSKGVINKNSYPPWYKVDDERWKRTQALRRRAALNT